MGLVGGGGYAGIAVVFGWRAHAPIVMMGPTSASAPTFPLSEAIEGPRENRHARHAHAELRRLPHRQTRDRIHLDALARSAVDRGDRRACRAVALALPVRVQALGGADAEGVPAGDHHRARARTVARFRERARRRLRRRPFRSEPAARSVRRPRSADARRLSPRRSGAALRLPRFAVRRGDRRRRAARPRGPRLRRRRQARGGARGHAPALAARAFRRATTRRPRRSPTRAFEPEPMAVRTRRCGS